MIPSETSQSSARLGLPYVQDGQMAKHVTMNEALTRLDVLAQAAIVSRTLAAQPETPDEGALYLMCVDAAGDDWSGFDEGDLARFEAGSWRVEAPVEGMLVFVADEQRLIVRAGDEWRDLTVLFGRLDDLTHLGVGTGADDVNRFAARLNTALWTALAAGDGGTGDLRYVMNKEGADDTLSLLFQSGWQGRAEIGLTGDDDLRIKVSADGAGWREAAKFDRASGAVSLAGIGPLVRPETIAAIEAFSVHPGRRRVFLIDDLVAALVTAGVWDRLDLFWLCAAHDEQAARVNLRTPGFGDLTAVNSPAFTADRGFKGDGVAAHLTAGLGYGALERFTLNDATMFGWDQFELAENSSPLIGGAGGGATSIYPRSALNTYSAASNTAPGISVSGGGASPGLPAWTRTGPTASAIYRDGVLVATSEQASTGLGLGDIALLRSGGNHANRRIAAGGLGASLTAAQHAALHAALHAYLTAVGAAS